MPDMERFRPAKASDIDTVVEMMRRYYAADGYSFIEADARNAALTLLQNEHLGRLWVVQMDGALVGYLAVTLGFSLEYRGQDAFIDELFISEAKRGQGLGREAVAVAEAYCREHGVQALHLEVEHHRTAAQTLYRRAGFSSHDRCLMTKLLYASAPLEATPGPSCEQAPAAG